MSHLCKAVTITRTRAGDSRTAHPCQWSAKENGYCAVHNPEVRRKVLERQKRHLSGRLNVVLTELIGVTAECDYIAELGFPHAPLVSQPDTERQTGSSPSRIGPRSGSAKQRHWMASPGCPSSGGSLHS